MTIRRQTPKHQTILWLAFAGTACLLPSACGGDTNCNGPGGFCLSPPGSSSGGTQAQGGRGGSTGGRAGSSAGGSNGSGNGGESGDGQGGSGGSTSGGGQGGSGNGGQIGTAGKGGQGGSIIIPPNGGAAGVPPFGGTGGAPSGFCPPESAFVPTTCAAAGGTGEGGSGGDAGGWCEVGLGQGGQASQGGEGGNPGFPVGGEGGVATAGSGGTTGKGDPINPTFLSIDDLEDGDELTLPILGGRGVWFISNDGTGQQYPEPCPIPSPMGRAGSAYAMRTFGRDFRTTSTDWAQLGLALRSGAPDCNDAIDASGLTGVRFWARGTGKVRFMIMTAETSPVGTDMDGTCITGCHDHHGIIVQLQPQWTEYFYPFQQLAQAGWGTPASFNPSNVLGFLWHARDPNLGLEPVACFDFMIDDVALYKD